MCQPHLLNFHLKSRPRVASLLEIPSSLCFVPGLSSGIFCRAVPSAAGCLLGRARATAGISPTLRRAAFPSNAPMLWIEFCLVVTEPVRQREALSLRLWDSYARLSSFREGMP